VHRAFPVDQVVVIGLHTVFERHDVMGADALAAFVSEYRWEFPIAIDRHDGDDPVPATMRAYGLQGTPSTVLIDCDGYIPLSAFGAVDELQFGAALGRLLVEPVETPTLHEAQAGVCLPGQGCT
jgi:hypothetical protein